MTLIAPREREIQAFLYHDHERDGQAMRAAVEAAVDQEVDRLGLDIAVHAFYTLIAPATATEQACGRVEIHLIGYNQEHESADSNLMHLEAAAVAAIHKVDPTAEVDSIG